MVDNQSGKIIVVKRALIENVYLSRAFAAIRLHAYDWNKNDDLHLAHFCSTQLRLISNRSEAGCLDRLRRVSTFAQLP